MNELGYLKKIYRADPKSKIKIEYRPATPFIFASPLKETSPEVLKEYVLLIVAIGAAILCFGILLIFSS
jgi:hypothetical protein